MVAKLSCPLSWNNHTPQRRATSCLAPPLHIQIPAHVPGKAAEGWPSAWVPVPTWGTQIKLWVADFKLDHQQVKDNSIFVSPSFSVTILPFK